MTLTAEQFSAIIRSLGDAVSSPRVEKRRAARAKYRACVDVTLCAEDGTEQRRMSILLSNISLRGLGLVSHLNLRSGQQFVLHLPHEPEGALDMLCTIVYSRSRPGGLYNVGAEFNCPIGPSSVGTQSDKQVEQIRNSILD